MILFPSGKDAAKMPYLYWAFLAVSPLYGHVGCLFSIFGSPDKSQLVNLDEIAKIAKEQNLTIHISGAADKATGSNKRNRHLSIERAKYICKQLIKRGISKDAMKATSLGGINQFTPKEANRFGVILLSQ